MQLDKYDQALLDGEYGETKQKMMEILVSLGKIYDAERLSRSKMYRFPARPLKPLETPVLSGSTPYPARQLFPHS